MVYKSESNKQLLTLKNIPFQNAELIIAGGTECVEVLLFRDLNKASQKFILINTRMVSLIQYYPESKLLLMTQPKYSVNIFKVELKKNLEISDFYSVSFNDVGFIYFNSVFLLEEPQKTAYILSTITVDPSSKIESNIDYYTISSETKEITDMFFFKSSHENNITCIIGVQNCFDIIIGDAGGCISKHRIVKENGKYLCEPQIEPLRCMSQKIYMMSISYKKEFFYVGNDAGNVSILKVDTLEQVRAIEMSSLFVSYYFVQSINTVDKVQAPGKDPIEEVRMALDRHSKVKDDASDGFVKEIQSAFF